MSVASLHRARQLDAGALRHLLEIGAEAGVALLVAGLAVVAVVDADDRQIRRIEQRDGRKRADVHQKLAVASDNKNAPVAPRQRETKPDHAGATHRSAHGKAVGRVLCKGGDVARRASKSGNDQKILMPANERRQRLAPVECEDRCIRGRVVVCG